MRAQANANADDGAHAAATGDVPEVTANADDGAHAPENDVNISSTLAQLRILIRLIHHVQLRCLIRLIHPVQLHFLIKLIHFVIVQKNPIFR